MINNEAGKLKELHKKSSSCSFLMWWTAHQENFRYYPSCSGLHFHYTYNS